MCFSLKSECLTVVAASYYFPAHGLMSNSVLTFSSSVPCGTGENIGFILCFKSSLAAILWIHACGMVCAVFEMSIVSNQEFVNAVMQHIHFLISIFNLMCNVCGYILL